MGFCTYAEISVGIIVSCLPVLPRLFQNIGPRIYSAFSSGVKNSDMTPVQRMGKEKCPDGRSNWHEMRTEVSGNSPSLNEHGPKQLI